MSSSSNLFDIVGLEAISTSYVNDLVALANIAGSVPA